MANKKKETVSILSTATPRESVTVDQKVLLSVATELTQLRKIQTDARQNFDYCYVEWNEFEALCEKQGPDYRAAERARLARKRDDAAAVFDAATIAFESARDAFLADPLTREAAEAELAEIDKREIYQSSQMRGKGTTGDRGNRDFIRYRLKKSEVVTISGKNNPVYYPETALHGCISPKQLMGFLATDGSSVSPAAITAVVSRIESELLKLVRTNHSVNFFNLFIVSPTLRGTCTEAETESYFHRSFTPYLSVRATPKFTRTFRSGLGARKIAGPARNVYIAQILVPTASGMRETLTPPARAYLRIRGKGIKYNPAAEDEGLFFVMQENNREVPIRSIGFPNDITSGTINCQLPAELVSGMRGHLVLRIRKTNSSKLTEEQYPVLLTIADQPA